MRAILAGHMTAVLMSAGAQAEPAEAAPREAPPKPNTPPRRTATPARASKLPTTEADQERLRLAAIKRVRKAQRQAKGMRG